MGNDQRLELRVSVEWLARLDAARGGTPRGTFVKGTVEKALGGHQQGGNAREAEEPDKMVKREPLAPPRPAPTATVLAAPGLVRASSLVEQVSEPFYDDGETPDG